MDYGIFYTVVFSVLMSVSACATLTCSKLKTIYPRFRCFLMICAPKTIFSVIRYYFENFESNYLLIAILLASMMIFDALILFFIFDAPMLHKIVLIASLDIIFMPVLLAKQAFESKFLTEQNTLVFENLLQPVLMLLCYTVIFAGMLCFAHFFSKLIIKMKFKKPLFDIFNTIALVAYLFIELNGMVMFIQNDVGRTNQLLQYFNSMLIYGSTMLALYLISNHLTTKRLRRELETISETKQQQYTYYDMVKKHNEEIRKIKHDLNSHFDVMSSLINSNQYEKLNDYISGLSYNYNQIKKVVFTSNMLVDAVISTVVEKCDENNISFSFEGALPDPCFVDDISLTCLFSNILSNAVEACKNVTDERYINLSVICKKECIVIVCKNSKIHIAEKRNIFESTKKSADHGFGIKIIKDVVSNYNGIVNFTDNKNEFEVNILLHPDNN